MSSSFEVLPVGRPLNLRGMGAVLRTLRRLLAVDLRYVDPWERKRG
jgi:hypothetical protein